MKSHTLIIGLVSLAMLAGCTTKAGDIRYPVITQEDSYAEARAKTDVFLDEVLQPALEGKHRTHYDDLPDFGTATYDGFTRGLRNEGQVVPASYVANLQLTIEFATEAVTGTSYGIVTDVVGFEMPEGEIDFTGVIDRDDDEVEVFVNGRGPPEGECVNAIYDADGYGYLRGDNGQVASGEAYTNFFWSNPDWPDSYSDGFFSVLQQ
ncbi:MAG: hypothetical protein QNJ35_09460 [Paracoccaceae bacterium]|nr:hypothetical protein [Paracoccaceae bacterium]